MMRTTARTKAAALAAAALAVALVSASGCAKDPTAILTLVTVDTGVPRVAVIRASIRNSRGGVSSSDIRSPQKASMEDAGPAEFILPALLHLGVPSSWSGPAEVTVEALDWQTWDVVGRGSTGVDIVANQKVNATVHLLPTAPPAGDGGADGGAPDGPASDGAADGPAEDDGGADAGTDEQG